MQPARTSLLGLSATLLVASAATAQTGPWKSSELVVLTTRPSDGSYVLNRIDPTTGHGAEFKKLEYYFGYAGGSGFDPFRNAFFVNASIAPDSWAMKKLWVLQHDGTGTTIPEFDGLSVRGICSVGDGRVFLQEHTPYGPHEILWLDATNTVHALLDESGTAPFDLAVEHLLYDEPSNALIATSSTSGWGAKCQGSSVSSVFRIPLSVDGTKVAGAVTCIDYATGHEGIVGLDHLPNGRVLITLASTYIWPDKLLSLNPLTLGLNEWAEVDPHDINGGHWNEAIGRAIVLDDGYNVLRMYDQGDSGLGTELPTDVPVSDFSSGFTPAETIWEIEIGSTDGNYCLATVNSTGQPASFSIGGSTSISANDLTLYAQPVPNQPFFFFFGPNKIQVPFGNGYLCVGGGITRILPVGNASSNVATRSPNLSTLGVTPGALQFQCWFRDPMGGGSLYNTSDGYQITLLP